MADFKIDPRPSTMEALLYQRRADFQSAIEIGGPAPDGACFKMDGQQTTLLGELKPERLTILNFGS